MLSQVRFCMLRRSVVYSINNIWVFHEGNTRTRDQCFVRLNLQTNAYHCIQNNTTTTIRVWLVWHMYVRGRNMIGYFSCCNSLVYTVLFWETPTVKRHSIYVEYNAYTIVFRLSIEYGIVFVYIYVSLRYKRNQNPPANQTNSIRSIVSTLMKTLIGIVVGYPV